MCLTKRYVRRDIIVKLESPKFSILANLNRSTSFFTSSNISDLPFCISISSNLVGSILIFYYSFAFPVLSCQCMDVLHRNETRTYK